MAPPNIPGPANLTLPGALGYLAARMFTHIEPAQGIQAAPDPLEGIKALILASLVQRALRSMLSGPARAINTVRESEATFKISPQRKIMLNPIIDLESQGNETAKTVLAKIDEVLINKFVEKQLSSASLPRPILPPCLMLCTDGQLAYICPGKPL